MTQRTFRLRSCMLVLGLIAMMAAIVPTTASAQYDCNGCDSLRISVSADIPCRFELCVRTYGPTVCTTAVPGRVYGFRCIEVAQAYILDCNGSAVGIPADGSCVDIIVATGCCVTACFGYDANNCPVIRVRKAVVHSCVCP